MNVKRIMQKRLLLIKKYPIICLLETIIASIFLLTIFKIFAFGIMHLIHFVTM